MLKLIIFIILYFLERVLTYKLLKKIDKKERLKVNQIELKHYEKIKEKEEE